MQLFLGKGTRTSYDDATETYQGRVGESREAFGTEIILWFSGQEAYRIFKENLVFFLEVKVSWRIIVGKRGGWERAECIFILYKMKS